MLKKLCLFCDAIVPVESAGDHDKFIGCWCSPDGSYSLVRDSYDSIRAFPYHKKRLLFPIISAYIRELTDCEEKVVLSVDDLETIGKSPQIPVSIEEKESRLLQYLYRHSEGPGDPIVIQPLSNSYNLTYSPNQQELVYIIEKLREERSIVRESVTFKLTEKGWSEAAARAGGRKLKACFVLLTENNDKYAEWTDKVLPKLEQCGYLPRLLQPAARRKHDIDLMQQVSKSKLVIADLSTHSPEVYFAAGYALGLNIPVIWTVNRSETDRLAVLSSTIRPIVWETSESLAMLLQQKLITV